MTFLDPQGAAAAITDAIGTASGGAIGGDQSQGIPPLTPNAPSAMKALTRKYTPANIAALHATYGPELTNQFVQWEISRAQQGVSPVNAQGTINALLAAKTRQSPTPAPSRDPWDVLNNAASDVGDIVQSIPKMPEQIGHDILHAGEIPADLGKVASGDIGELRNTPLVRMVPGVYTASNLAQGNISELASHPVMTGLDVAPFAHAVGAGDLVRKIPLPGEEGLHVGDVIDRTKAALGRSMPGQFVRESVGPEVRDVSRIMAEKPEQIQQAALPQMAGIYNSTLDKIRQGNTPVEAEIDRVVPDRMRQGQLKAAITDPVSVGATDAQSALDAVNATDAERGAVQQYLERRDATNQYGLDAGLVTNRVVNGVTETFTPEDAAKIDVARGKATRVTTLAGLRDAILNPTTADFGALHDQVMEALRDPKLTAKQIRNIGTGYVHALDVAGYDTGTLLGDINASSKGRMGTLIDDIDHTQLQPAGSVKTRPARGVPSLDSRTRWLERNSEMTQKAVDKVTAKVGNTETKVLPARWQPAFQRLQMDAAHDYIQQTFPANDPQVPALLEQVHGHMYDSIPLDERKLIDQQALAAVTQLRAQGIDPEWVHSVSLGQEKAIASPSVTTLVPKASQYGARINDWTPGSDSLSVSLHHQGLELARQQGARAALDEIRDAHTTSMSDALAELRPTAQRIAARTGADVGSTLERLMNQTYRKWSETESGFMAGRADKFKFSDINKLDPADSLLIHKHIANSLEMLAAPPAYSRIFNPALKVFRTAVLPFSPRWFTHHIVGNMISGLLEDPRFVAELPAAWSAARDIGAMSKALEAGRPYDLAPETYNLLERMPASSRAQIASLKYSVEPDTAFKMKAGGKMGELAHTAGIDRIAKAGGRVADWSYNFVNTADTMYRMAGYLAGEKGGLTAGLDAAEAGARGMALTNRFMPRWLEMTPMERSVFRAVFPFYGLMSHVMRYAMRFPVDHPWRTAVMANISRAELHDFGTGLPQMLAGTFFLPSDSKGNQVGINVPTPFVHLGDEFTLAGLLGETNPLFKVALQQAGYDPATKGPNLYPELAYDPTTGKLEAKPMTSGGMLGTTVTSLIPQANIIAALTGTSGDLKNLMSSNPDAANRLLLSSGGIPLLWKNYNLNQQAFQTEAVRSKLAQQVFSDALKSGDYSKAMQYPSLRPAIAKLSQLQQAGKLTAFVKGATLTPLAPTPNATSTPTVQTNNARVAANAGPATSQAENAA